MNDIQPPRPEDFGLSEADAPLEGMETIKMGGLGVPKRLSPTWNWVLGLSVAVPLAGWSLWGLIDRIPSLVLGISIGGLAAIVVFQLAVSVVPMIVDVLLYGLAMLVDDPPPAVHRRRLAGHNRFLGHAVRL